MANLLVNPTETEERDAAARRRNEAPHLGGEDLAAAEESVFSSLWNSIYDAFFPKKLPPLVLQSQPIAVADPMAVKRDPKSTAAAIVMHILIIGLLAYLVAKKVQFAAPVKEATIVALDAPPPPARRRRRSWAAAAVRRDRLR